MYVGHRERILVNRYNLDLSPVSTPGPEKRQNQRKGRHSCGHPDQMQWLMTFCPSAEQIVETVILKGHTWKADEYSIRSSPETSPETPGFEK